MLPPISHRTMPSCDASIIIIISFTYPSHLPTSKAVALGGGGCNLVERGHMVSRYILSFICKYIDQLLVYAHDN